MIRDKVDSSLIESIGYDEKSSLLEIEFKSKAVYQFTGVNKRQFKQLISAESIGKAFNSKIKPNFDYKKIKGSK